MRSTRGSRLTGLDAGAFTFVMATGIVSVAAWLQGLPALSDALLVIAVAVWIVLALAASARMLRVSPVRPRLQSFAFVAATTVVGVHFLLAGDRALGLALWSLALLSWLALLARRPRLDKPTGGSLLVIVSTESLAVLAAPLAVRWWSGLLAVAVASWAIGLVLYPLVAIALARAFHRERRFEPDLWILMGALAIGTLAGTEVLVEARALHLLGSFVPWLRDLDLAVWAAASAWILPLLAAELHSPTGWNYRASRWSFVFPLGMYAVATQTLGGAVGITGLHEIARVFFVVALAPWAVVVLGLVRYTPSHGR